MTRRTYPQNEVDATLEKFVAARVAELNAASRDLPYNISYTIELKVANYTRAQLHVVEK